MKSEKQPDPRDQLFRAVHALKQEVGPRIAAHTLYMAALDLTAEADALAAREASSKE